MKPFSIEFIPGRIGQSSWGWVCRMWFKVATVNQFTDEAHQVHASSRWWWLACFRARREAKRLYQRLAAKPGERAALGWGD